MSNLLQYFEKAEHKWFDIIHNHLKSIYSGIHLPSHNIAHHIRVWRICKELMLEFETFGMSIPKQLPEQALIASLFHDTGLIHDKSERHGYQSKVICEEFFTNHTNQKVDNLEAVLNAIEHHDDKNIKCLDKNASYPKIDLLTIVSTADDLDAFGYIGVYRYFEIYTLRGFSFDDIPRKIIDNLEIRFKNFSNGFSMLTSFFAKHSERFSITLDFFKNAENEVITNSTEIGEFSAICKNLSESLIDNKMDISNAIANGLIMFPSKTSLDFYIELKDELGL